MTIWMKQDVQGDLHPVVVKAECQVHKIYQEGGEDLYITSHREGKHNVVTLHPHGWAFDFRKPRTMDTRAMRTKIKKRLGRHFDVVISPKCMHVEYDPK